MQTEGAEAGPEPTQRSTDAERKTDDEEEALTARADAVDQLDFYKPDPFVHGQTEGTSQAPHVEADPLRYTGA